MTPHFRGAVRHILVSGVTVKRKRGLRGFSLIELLIVISIILIIVAIAVPKFSKILMSTREMSAQATIKTLLAAQAQYYSTYGRYAASLQELGKPTSGNPSATSADLISEDLAKGEKQGYKYNIQATPTGFTINADPATFGNSGGRTFFTDQTQEIHQHIGQEPATAADPEIK